MPYTVSTPPPPPGLRLEVRTCYVLACQRLQYKKDRNMPWIVAIEVTVIFRVVRKAMFCVFGAMNYVTVVFKS